MIQIYVVGRQAPIDPQRKYQCWDKRITTDYPAITEVQGSEIIELGKKGQAKFELGETDIRLFAVACNVQAILGLLNPENLEANLIRQKPSELVEQGHRLCAPIYEAVLAYQDKFRTPFVLQIGLVFGVTKSWDVVRRQMGNHDQSFVEFMSDLYQCLVDSPPFEPANSD